MTIKQHVDAMYEMRQKGATWDAIAKHFGTHTDATRVTVLMFYPDTPRYVSPRVQRPPPAEHQFVRKDVDVTRATRLRKAGMSLAEIGRVLGVSHVTVASRLRDAGEHDPKSTPARKPGRARNIRMTDAEYETYCMRGGIAWLRSILSCCSTADTHSAPCVQAVNLVP